MTGPTGTMAAVRAGPRARAAAGVVALLTMGLGGCGGGGGPAGQPAPTTAAPPPPPSTAAAAPTTTAPATPLYSLATA